jgi:thiamine biosynthesis protein ThiS
MKIKLNGEDYETVIETVAQLLEELRIVPGRVAVELNLSILKKADYGTCPLHDGDAVEVVNFVGGG